MKKCPTKNIVEYHLPICRSGLGDIFMDLITSLNVHSLPINRNKTMKLIMYYDDFTPGLGCDTMDEILDFYCLKKPNFKYESFKLKINDIDPDTCELYFKKNFNIEKYGDVRTSLFNRGFTWPYTIKKDPKKTNISFMFYNHNFFKDGEKEITDFDEIKFIDFMRKYDDINFIPIYQYVKDNRTKINPVRLNPYNMMKDNLQIIANSSMFVGSEGLWTHMSRYLGTHTVMITTNPEWEREAKKQKHQSYRNMNDLLDYLEKKIHEICT